MRSTLRVLAFALLGLAAVDAAPAEAQLWKPAKKPEAAAPAKPTRAKPTRAKKPRRAARPARATTTTTTVTRRPVDRDDDRDARLDRGPRDRGDTLPEFDDAPEIVVESPGRGER